MYSVNQLPVDAVPDITNNQVQVVTTSPSLAPQEVEQLITFPVELSVANIPNVTEIRSISRYGLSVVTIVFESDFAVLDARQFVAEQLKLAADEIPDGLGTPELMPITTGLGEIYQYTLDVDPEYREFYGPMELRTIQDWIVKRQLSGIPGIIEVSSFGGYLKQYEVAVDPRRLRSQRLTLAEIFNALESNNQNSGGSYIEKNTNAYYIRTEGRVQDLSDIENIIIKHQGKTPLRIRDVAEVRFGSPKRYGAMTKDGLGEAVGGITLMLKGANSSEAIKNVQDRVEMVQKSLPMGVRIESYLDRSDLVGRAINTVRTNLVEGGLIVIFVLVLLLGNLRAGFIVASVIPLSLLFAFIMMHLFGVSANLMSLGAIDFGIVVDGAVIIVESILHTLKNSYAGRKLEQKQMDQVISDSASKIYRSAAFGILIILVVFLPILSLTGIEGKMFKPMAYTVSFAILGAMILSMTYVPVMSTLVLSKRISSKKSFSEKIIDRLKSLYKPTLERALSIPKIVLSLATVVLLSAIFVFTRMGSEFIPTLEEGDLAMQMTIQPGSSLEESIQTATQAETILLENFPEVEHVVSKIGTAEVPTDPMAIEDADIMIILKPKSEWVSASRREDLVAKMKDELSIVIGASFEFTQPIQLRFNELMTGAKTDIAIKVFGESTDELARLARSIEESIVGIRGAGDVKIEQTEGLPQLLIEPQRHKLAQYQINVDQVNEVIRTAFAGEKAGVVFEEEKKFDLVVRIAEKDRQDLDLNKLFVTNPKGNMIPLSEIVTTSLVEGPLQISREDAKRRITVGVNVRNRDVASLVEEIQRVINSKVKLPAGYFITYGGDFENLQAARQRLTIAVPVALSLIFIFLYMAFGNLKYSLMIFTAVPLSAIGGIYALLLRDMPFSISAGVGFIALFGVAVLNGIVLISHLNELYDEGKDKLLSIVIKGSISRLRPVLMTASVAAFGFLPMALSATAGAEVQKPLATVVIGGLITSTLLTLIVLPTLYLLFKEYKPAFGKKTLAIITFLLLGFSIKAQPALSLQEALDLALANRIDVIEAQYRVQQADVRKGSGFAPGATEFDYQRGNINSFFDDYMLEIRQPIGNPFQAIAENNSLKSQYQLSLKEERITEKQVLLETEVKWLQWYFQYQNYRLLSSMSQEIRSLDQIIARAVQAGEINIMTKQLWQQIQWQQSQKLANATDEYRKRWMDLKTWCDLSGQFVPGPWELELYDNTPFDSLSSLFISRYDHETNYLQYELNAHKAGYLPDLSVGYFQQQIDGVTGLDGWRITASLPLYFIPQKKTVTEQKLQNEYMESHYGYKIREMQNELGELRKVQEHLRELLQENHLSYDNKELKQGLEAGEINLFQYLTFFSTQIENQLMELAIKLRYAENQARINFLTTE